MNLAKWLVVCGIGLIVLGVLVWIGFPFGKLPGDIHIKGEKTDIYFPLTTSILISIILTLILNFIFWIIRK